MKFLKKSISVFLCIIISAATLFAESAYALESNGVTYDLEDGSLIVMGSGDMLKTYKDDLSLTEVYFMNGITSVPAEAFSGCANLQKVVMYNSVVSLGKDAFKGCTSLSQLKISRSLETICESTFEGCSSLTEIKLPESLVTIEANAFKDCSSLNSLIITQNVETIASGAFDGCDSLANVYYAGYQTGFDNVQKPDGIFSSANIEYLSPELVFKKDISEGTVVLTVTYKSGRFGSLDGQFEPVGNISVTKLKFARQLTSSSNSKQGRFAVVGDEYFRAGSDVVAITYGYTDCENSQINIKINSCAVMVGTYDVAVPIDFDGEVVTLEHQFNEPVITAPTAEKAGSIKAVCSMCNRSVDTELPFIFKNCTVDDTTAIIPKYQLSEDAFRNEYLTCDFPVVTGAYGEFIGTGSKVTADYGSGVVFDYDISVVGDTDGDGLCDARDAVIIMCINEGLLSADSLEKCVKIAADANSDNTIEENDAIFALAKGIAR